MQKFTAIILLLFFLIANSCVAVRLHWCGGNLASIDFFSRESHSCKCGKMVMKPGCCKNKTVHLKANNEFAKTTNYKIINSIISKLPYIQTQFFEVLPICHFCQDFSINYKPPPYLFKTPIFILDSVFLI